MWKGKAKEAMKRLKARDAEAKRDAQAQEKLKAANDKLRQRQDEIESILRKRLVDAERELVTAREQLMAIDVKLDILEGAANVLDSRTRAAFSKQHAGTVARV
jgi:chromosome segregation ATPase